MPLTEWEELLVFQVVHIKIVLINCCVFNIRICTMMTKKQHWFRCVYLVVLCLIVTAPILRIYVATNVIFTKAHGWFSWDGLKDDGFSHGIVLILFAQNSKIWATNSTRTYTPPKINMEPEKKSLEKKSSSWKPSFSGSILNFGGVPGPIKETIVFQASLFQGC